MARYNPLASAIKLALLSGLASTATAAMVEVNTVAQQPLVVSSFSDPNMMLLIDSSGSMRHVVPDTPYDATVTYTTCTASRTYSTSDAVYIRVQSDGDPYFGTSRTGGSHYDWGTTGGNGITGRTKKCFDPAGSYQATLHGDSGSNGNTKYAAGSALSVYSGNYLNWYFGFNRSSNAMGTQAENFGSNARLKPNQSYRMEIARTAADSLLDSITNMKVGLSKYDGSSGVYILEGISDIGSTAHRADLKSRAAGITHGGGTPLAEAFEELGRYFIEGYDSQDLTLHEGESYQVKAAGSAVFSHTPRYRDSSDEPSSSDAVITSWCQKSFIVAMTDGQPNNDDSVSSYLEDYDRDCTSGSTTYYNDTNKPAACEKNPSDSNFLDRKNDRDYYLESSSTASDFLDDVAQAMWEIDLRPDLNKPSGDPVNQSVASFMVGFADDQVINDPLMTDVGNQAGGAFLTASTASDLLAAFSSATQSIYDQVGSATSVAFNSSSLDTGSSIFIAQFNTTRWSGKVFNFELDPASGKFIDASTGTTSDSIQQVNPSWEASSVLDAMTYTSRQIYTYDGANGVGFSEADRVAGNLSSTMEADLTNAQGTQAQALAFIAGDRSLESSTFRQRDSRLGDIVNSTPVFVGDPNGNYPEVSPFPTGTNAYSAWRAKFRGASATLSREPMIYVGSNDGMLHGFNANLKTTDDGGDEEMAYVPNFLASANTREGLGYLGEKDYAHRFYVDHTVSVGDVYIESPTSITKKWRTILVGGARAGGRGLYALDVSDTGFNASSDAAQTVLWEFTNSDDADLGYTFSRATIVMTADNKWAAIVGNGYNADVSNGADGKAKLFILFIEEGMDGWSSSDYIELDTGIGSTAIPNGLSSPRVIDTDGDRIADRVYAGDLYGNLWCFDISASQTSKWGSCFGTKSGKTFTPDPLFKTTSASLAPTAASELQPITQTPLAARVPNTDGITVYFGTGQYVLPADISNTDPQAFYAVLHKNTGATGNITPSDLAERTITTTSIPTATGGTAYLRKTSSTNAGENDWFGSNHLGYFMTLPTLGERSVTRATIISDVLFFNTIIPDSAECSFGGSGWLMSIDYSNGLPPKEAVFDANLDGKIDATDLGYVGVQFLDGLPSESKVLGNKRYTAGSDGKVQLEDVNLKTTNREGRLAWEELSP